MKFKKINNLNLSVIRILLRQGFTINQIREKKLNNAKLNNTELNNAKLNYAELNNIVSHISSDDIICCQVGSRYEPLKYNLKTKIFYTGCFSGKFLKLAKKIIKNYKKGSRFYLEYKAAFCFIKIMLKSRNRL